MKINIDLLNTHPNSRPLSERRVAELVAVGGGWEPIVVNSNLKVVEGGHRLEAHRRLGHTQVEVVQLSDEEIARLDDFKKVS